MIEITGADLKTLFDIKARLERGVVPHREFTRDESLTLFRLALGYHDRTNALAEIVFERAQRDTDWMNPK